MVAKLEALMEETLEERTRLAARLDEVEAAQRLVQVGGKKDNGAVRGCLQGPPAAALSIVLVGALLSPLVM